MTVKFRSQIQALTPYKPGKPIEDVKKEYGISKVFKMASNENPLGCSPLVKEAINKSLDYLNLYPDGNATKLKYAIATKLGIKPSQVQPSSGSDEMVDQIAKTFINEGDEVILADVTFPRYITTTTMMGGIPVVVPLKNFTYDLDAMKRSITDKTRLIWLCNPNNPTGTMFSEKALLDFLDSVPSHVIIVYDEAYNEYVTSPEYPHNSVSLLEKYPNIIILRTFSKIYGLAALRIGYTLASEHILSNIDKIRSPFNVNSLAQTAAVAALNDDEFLKDSYACNKEGKAYLCDSFDSMGITYAPSEANHIFFDSGKECTEVFTELQKRGVIVRPMYNTYIRVSIGTMEENKFFISQLKEVLELNVATA
ncbi:histidinol-phosphate transaminase [Serpentinicella sp. ANB-PHB4]|uniref:histidinol-phosphate transaminase n=1 Tax=Serpentinicella sp. ANB-PHB4 TaxID=3074076 RepID=UPI0028672AB2|nr:histidinol-phosphate transaminase [Serpentinicella sp. ANB-PHB4]MDR5660077.1 histidinol-phosphate transaminase [Serpentinicella sp. ANB-PHB4]